MENPERNQALRRLSDSREVLRQKVDGLSGEQRSFRPAAERWSIADCIEHLTIVETFTLQRIQQLLEQPPAGKPDTHGKDELILGKVPVRGTRVKGPEAVMPAGRWPDFDDLLRQFEAARQRTIDFGRETGAELRAYAFPHPFLGPLDWYQWLLFLAAHCERHAGQMEEVKSDPAFPGKVGTAIA